MTPLSSPAFEAIEVGKLAATDNNKAAVLKHYGIDYCCGGKRTLGQVCAEMNIDLVTIEKQLVLGMDTPPATQALNFDNWQLDFLIDYIYNQHHLYYYQEAPVIAELLHKVVKQHGQTDSYLLELDEVFQSLQHELNSHFKKEENVLFPYIRHLVKLNRGQADNQPQLINDIHGPLQVMEAEHEAAGGLLVQLRKLTNNYTLPSTACSSYALLYSKLQALEADLHQHIHLENNILFAKALKLEKQNENTTA